ncbi:NAD-dependent epimerase/dehydratase family protein [Bailinhaonella thermotolerans]|uniref:NAD-dependent epimerase/dehydratase family protein n=2 Tax=Bailinhaonella thermotolerans TaxID=1070861 RepID=A0A3A4A4U1_9ACTN|nr:NAD-dependent epimerase/dehydratase family protein [Bailinhaonella thermotolerans]RJL20160.1 NAD-dependent epimerase/dehydratase family protein [Bailinhaonella thermotolerans]
MARALVTGGCGFVGSHLVAALAGRGDEVVVFDGGPPPPDQSRDGVRYVPGDIRDRDALASALRDGVDVVYHLAAVVGVDRYLERPLDVIDINLMGTRNVLELAADAGAKVVLASTSEVFGKNPAVPWAEDADRVLGSTAVDRWSYSSSKALAEHLTFGMVRACGLRATIVRYFNVYGPRQRPAFVVSRSVHRALRGLPLVRYDDGAQTRCFTYVADAVEATLRAADDPRADGECFNVGSSVETTVRQAIELVAELTGAETITELDTAARLGETYQDLSRRIPDTSKAAAVLGWKASTPLREGLARTIDWARRNPWWLDQPDSGGG